MGIKRVLAVIWLVALAFVSQIEPVVACATCGCSEICPLVMLKLDQNDGQASTAILSNSIWGNIILKLAYKRDEKLQKLAKKLNMVTLGTVNSFLLVSGDTLGQNVVSVSVLNPPDGKEDSYVPGSIGIVAEGLTNIVLTGQMVLTTAIRHKIKRRQREIQEEVEAILQHLEYSQAECPDADKDLTRIIGAHAARECIELWRSSHETAELSPAKPTASVTPTEPTASMLPAESLSTKAIVSAKP